jgi:hypothetical protein
VRVGVEPWAFPHTFGAHNCRKANDEARDVREILPSRLDRWRCGSLGPEVGPYPAGVRFGMAGDA